MITVRAPRFAPGAPTRRSCEAASRFGLLLDEHTGGSFVGDGVRVACAPGTVTLLTGPSGAGKSTLLRCAADALREGGVRVLRLDEVRLREAPAVDLFRGTVDDAVRALARVGLGQASCFLRRPHELSDGQRWRLRLALAIDALERSAPGDRALVVDECCATLDPVSALGACGALRGAAARTAGLRVLAASSNPALRAWLRPQETVLLGPGAGARVERDAGSVDDGAPVTIERGTMRDYPALGSAHYRAGRPSRPTLVLTARLRDGLAPGHGGAPVGALVVTSPPLNSTLREIAWPGEYRTGDRRADAARLNAQVRTIARVVVDDRVRGLGIATALVRACLDSARTRRTETLGAMAGALGCFGRAGMARHALPAREPDARLLDALAHAGVERWRLAQGLVALERAATNAGRGFVEREVRAWARWGRAHRRWADAPLEEVFLRACRFAGAESVGFTHDAGA